jgi:SnoaL-like polyketide cyclase
LAAYIQDNTDDDGCSQIAEGDKVVIRYIGSGTHDLAEYEGLAPTGVRITIENIDRVGKGKIVDGRSLSDTSPLWQRRMEQERIERERIPSFSKLCE